MYSGSALPWRERFHRGRKYGKYDFGKFGRLVRSDHYLGRGKIGEVEVTCKFCFEDSRWGVLNRNPGGVVYLDLGFTEPPDCRLKGATVILTLDEEDEDLRHHFSAGNPPERAVVPVHITKHGPEKLQGTPDKTPSVGIGGIAELGGMGRDSEKYYIKRNYWNLSSQQLPDKLARATILRWDLTENKLDGQPRHANTFHAAFAFEHDGQPFFMQVEVSGSLEKVASHLRHKATQRFKKFKFPVEPQFATTLVNFGGKKNPYTDPLDELARNIPYNMVERNKKFVAQVPERPNPGPHYELIEEEPVMESENNAHNRPNSPQGIEGYQMTSIEDLRELRGEALECLSLGQASRRRTGIVNIPETLPLANDQHLETQSRRSSTPNRQVRTLNTSTVGLKQEQEQDEGTGEVASAHPPTNHLDIERFLEETPGLNRNQVMVLRIMLSIMKFIMGMFGNA